MAVLGRLLPWLGILVAVAACRTGPDQWGPFRAQVIDAETGRPIAGAFVMVTWMREPPSLHFSQWFYDAEETMTDTAGHFEMPRRTRVLTAFVSEPGIAVFAPGYLMQAPAVTPQDGRPYVDPTVVKMRPLKTREEQCRFEPFGVLPDAHAYVPRFVQALRDYQSELKCSDSR
jgi:hypothetical protein